MSKFKNLVLGAATVVSMAACGPKPHHDQGREEIKKDLIEVIVAGETQDDVLHIKNFNQAILNHDMEWALYNLASAYLSRTIYMHNPDAVEIQQNPYGLLPQVKEFSLVFWTKDNTKTLQDMIWHGEFWFGPNTLWGAMGTILNWSEILRKEKAEK